MPVDETGRSQLHEDISAHLHEFTGRGWLFERVNAWLDQPNENRFLLVGAAGTGKSAVAARLFQLSEGERASELYPRLGPGTLTYAHFCRALDSSVLDPLRFVETLAKSLAHRSSAYALALTQLGEQKIEINASQTVVTAESGAEVTVVRIGSLRIGELSAELAFERMIRRPLVSLSNEALKAPIIVLVDALDEALTLRGPDNLVTLIGGVLAAGLPGWFRFILTSRSDPRVLREIGKPDLDIETDAPQKLNEVRDYAHHRLQPLVEPKRGTLADKVAEAAGGNFLYARYVVDDLLADSERSDSSAFVLPKTLHDHYRAFLKRELGRTSESWRDRYRPVLGTLAVARAEGLTRTQLAGITGLRQSQTDDALKDCAQFLAGPSSTGAFHIYHQSFRDFLLTDEDFQIYPQEVNAAVAEYFMRAYGDDWVASEDKYALAFTVTHLLEALRTVDDASGRVLRDQLTRLLVDIGFAEAKVRTLGIDDVLADLHAAKTQVTLAGSFGQFARVLEREAHHLRCWNPTEQGTFFAQQLFNRAKIMKLDELASACSDRLDQLAMPYIRLRWSATRQSRELERILTGHSGNVWAVAVTPDGRWVVSGSDDGTLKMWDIQTGRELRSVDAGPVSALAVTPDGRLVVSGMEDGGLKAWDIETGQEVRSLDAHTEWVRAMALSPEGRSVIVGFADGMVQVFDLETGHDVCSFDAHADWVNAAVVDSRGLVLTGSDDGTIKTWDLNGHQIRVFSYDCAISAIAITPGGDLVVGKDDNSLTLCDSESGRELFSLAMEPDPSVMEESGISALIVTPDGNQVLAAHKSSISRWNLISRECVGTLIGHETGLDRDIFCLAVTPDGRRLVSGAGDSMVIVWDLETVHLNRVSSGHRRGVQAIGAAGESDHAVSISEDLEFRRWDISTGELIRVFVAEAGEDGGWVDDVAISDDLQTAVSFGNSAEIWDLVEMKRLGEIQVSLANRSYVGTRVGYEGGLNSVAVTRDGRRIAAAYYPWTGLCADVYNLPGFDHLCSISGTDDNRVSAIGPLRLLDVAFAPDCPALVAGTLDGHLEFNKFDPFESVVVSGHAERVSALAISPSGLIAVSAANDGTIKLWDTKASVEVGALPGRSVAIQALAFTPDGRKVIALFGDGVLKVLDARTLDEILELPSVNAKLFYVTSSVVQHVVICEQGDPAQVWDLQVGQLVTTLPTTDTGFRVEAIDINGRCCVLNRGNGELDVWSFAEGRAVSTFRHTCRVSTAIITRDGSRCVSGDEEGVIKLWDMETGKELEVFDQGTGDEVTAISVDGGERIAWGTKCGSVFVFSLQTEEGSSVSGLRGAITALDFCGWGGLIITRLTNPPAAPDAQPPFVVQVWDLSRAGGELEESLKLEIPYQSQASNQKSRVLLTRLIPDGMHLLCTSELSGLDIRTLDREGSRTLRSGRGDPIAAVFSPDGRSVAFGSTEGQVSIIDLQTDHVLLDVSAGESPVLAVAFAPDGRKLVTGSYDRGVRVWDVESSGLLATAKLEGPIETISAASDGVTLLVGDRMGSVSCMSFLEPGERKPFHVRPPSR